MNRTIEQSYEYENETVSMKEESRDGRSPELLTRQYEEEEEEYRAETVFLRSNIAEHRGFLDIINAVIAESCRDIWSN